MEPGETKSGGKQHRIPGTLPKRIKAVHDAAQEYIDARDRRMELTEIEVEKKAALIERMKKSKIKAYNDAEIEVTITTTEGVKAKRKDEGTEEAKEPAA